MAKLLEQITVGQSFVLEKYDEDECYEATLLKDFPFGILVSYPFLDPDSQKTGIQKALLLNCYMNLVLTDIIEDMDYGDRAWRCWDEMPTAKERYDLPWDTDDMTPDEEYPYEDIGYLDQASRAKTGKAVLVDLEEMEAGMLVWKEYYHPFAGGLCLQPLFVATSTDGLGEDDYCSFIPNEGLLYTIPGKASNKSRYWNCKPTNEERKNTPWTGDKILEYYY
ncbi:MAG: hypothetical protein IIZ39_04430 [Blautia sp.]|nr:hypothetical protein [Blautia sp.]